MVSFQNEIEEEHRRLSDADGGRNAERRQEIEEKREEAGRAKDDLRNYEDDLPRLEDLRRYAADEHKRAQNEVNKQRINKQQAEERLNKKMRDRSQQRSPYPQSMQQLLKNIQEDGGFQRTPVGPIGQHVRLSKPEWSSILEKSLGSSLDSFIVTSKEDQTRLSALMKDNKWYELALQSQLSSDATSSFPILIGRNIHIDTTAHEPDEQFDTSLRILEVWIRICVEARF